MATISTAVVYLIKSECACVIITSWGCTGGRGGFCEEERRVVKRQGGVGGLLNLVTRKTET